jgi:hypothetical protein
MMKEKNQIIKENSLKNDICMMVLKIFPTFKMAIL